MRAADDFMPFVRFNCYSFGCDCGKREFVIRFSRSVIPSFVRSLAVCAFVCCLAGFAVVVAVVALVSFWLWPNLEPQHSQFIGRVFTTNTVAS